MSKVIIFMKDQTRNKFQYMVEILKRLSNLVYHEILSAITPLGPEIDLKRRHSRFLKDNSCSARISFSRQIRYFTCVWVKFSENPKFTLKFSEISEIFVRSYKQLLQI